MEEIFYEDILETFLFCFIASAGIIQIMAARKGWHGLSIYGGRLRPRVNNAIGAALVVFAYAWYFSDPLHRNVRNIEAFMSLVCLVLGIAAAAAATALAASAADALRRGLGRRAARAVNGARGIQRTPLPEGDILHSRSWGPPGDNLVVIAEAGRGGERVLRRLHAALPEGRGLISIHPAAGEAALPGGPEREEGGRVVLRLLARADEIAEGGLAGETFMGLGWGGSALLRLHPELESVYAPRACMAVAPVFPDPSRQFVGDALLSNTPLDVAGMALAGKGRGGGTAKRLLRLWWPALAICVAAATAVTVAFDVRWKLFSGPAVGVLLSIWAAYFLARWRGMEVAGGASEAGAAARLQGGDAPSAASFPRMVVTAEDIPSFGALGGEAGVAPACPRAELWKDVLRGKFLLKKGTLRRLFVLIWEDGPEGP